MKNVFILAILMISSGLVAQDSVSYPIYFTVKSSEVDTLEQKILKRMIRNFDSFQIEKIVINAYGDDRGGKQVNNPLSKDRAHNIYLKAKELLNKKSDEILFQAFGRGFIPYDRQVEEAQRTRNRRGEITIFYTMNAKKEDKTKKTQSAPKQSINMKMFLDSAKDGEDYILDFQFENNSSAPDSNFRKEMDSLVSGLKKNKRKIHISSHTYIQGVQQDIDVYDAEKKNNELTRNRAKLIFDYLVKGGIDKKRLTMKGEGGNFPSGFGMKHDNRVEISIVDPPAVPKPTKLTKKTEKNEEPLSTEPVEVKDNLELHEDASPALVSFKEKYENDDKRCVYIQIGKKQNNYTKANVKELISFLNEMDKIGHNLELKESEYNESLINDVVDQTGKEARDWMNKALENSKKNKKFVSDNRNLLVEILQK